MGMNSSLGARLFPQFNYVSAAVAAATTAVVTRTPLLEVTFILGLNKYFIHLRYSLSSWLFFFFFSVIPRILCPEVGVFDRTSFTSSSAVAREKPNRDSAKRNWLTFTVCGNPRKAAKIPNKNESPRVCNTWGSMWCVNLACRTSKTVQGYNWNAFIWDATHSIIITYLSCKSTHARTHARTKYTHIYIHLGWVPVSLETPVGITVP